MDIDIVDFLRSNTGIIQCQTHDLRSTASIRQRSSNVISVRAHPGAGHLSIDTGTPGQSMIPLLEYKHSSPLTHYETVTGRIERTGSRLIIVIVR